jgi:hypothetical protein
MLDEDKSSFFYNYSKMIDNIVRESQNNMYTKIKDWTTIIIAIIPILYSIGIFCLQNNTYSFLFIPLLITITILSAALIQGLRILLHNEFVFNDPVEFIQKYHENDLDYIKLKMAATLASTSMENYVSINKRARQYKTMLYLMATSIVILMVTFWGALYFHVKSIGLT